MRLSAVAVLLAGCGRLGFAPADDGGFATTCGTVPALACDGFEGGLDVMWNQSTLNGAIGVDTTRAYRGASSLHVRVAAIASTSQVTDPHASLDGAAGQSPPITGTLYMRTWIYVPAPIDTASYLLQILNAADDLGNGISAGTRNSAVAANDYTSILYAESATALPLDRWTCLELAMPSGMPGTTRVYLDDTELTDAALPTQATQPAPTHVEVGLTWVGDVTNQGAVEAWLDEVVVDSQRIGCAR